MEKFFKVLVLMFFISDTICAKVEHKEKLILRIEEHIPSNNCNKTLENIQVCSIKSTIIHNLFPFLLPKNSASPF